MDKRTASRFKQATRSISEKTGFPQRKDIYKEFVSQFREFFKNWDTSYRYIAVCFDFGNLFAWCAFAERVADKRSARSNRQEQRRLFYFTLQKSNRIPT